MQAAESGLIHVEYQPEPDHSLKYLKVWLSTTRGYWKLVCEYWMGVSSFQHPSGISFSNGYYSSGLAQMLEFVMQYQDMFMRPSNPCYEGLVQIYPATEEERMAAERSMSEALDRVGCPSGMLAA
jgi:hypothetical protein